LAQVLNKENVFLANNKRLLSKVTPFDYSELYLEVKTNIMVEANKNKFGKQGWTVHRQQKVNF